MSAKDFSEVLDLIVKEDSRYDKGVYYFIRQALDHTIKGGDKKKSKAEAHISGQQLLEGIRDFALDQYGPMTSTLFTEWGVKECKDFGEIVFNLVDYGILGKTEDDSLADFTNGYDFYDAFERPFLPKGDSSMRN